MIIVLSGPGDLHADAVEHELRALGADHLRLDTSQFPDRIRLDLALDGDGLVRGSVRTDDRRLDLATIGAVWVRRPGRARAGASDLPDAARRIVSADASAVLADLWHLLDTRFVPGPPDVISGAAHKAGQLLRAARLGFDTPRTIIGNDPDAFLALVSRRPGGYITKRAAPSQRLSDADGEDVSRLTQPLRPRDLVHVDAWARCPAIVQAVVPKALELRVTVVGSAVFAVSIDSQRANHTRHDWRRFDHRHTPLRPYALPDDIAQRCRAITAGYGLSYSAIDLVLTPDGRHVFLELNPNGQYLWTEQATGLPISAALAELLVSGTVTEAPTPTTIPETAA